MPKVLNKYYCYPKEILDNCVYIGRPSKWGNPFKIGKDGSRDQVIEKYRRHIMMNPDLYNAVRTELKGKNLMCFCAPEPCHGDVLLRIANA